MRANKAAEVGAKLFLSLHFQGGLDIHHRVESYYCKTECDPSGGPIHDQLNLYPDLMFAAGLGIAANKGYEKRGTPLDDDSPLLDARGYTVLHDSFLNGVTWQQFLEAGPEMDVAARIGYPKTIAAMVEVNYMRSLAFHRNWNKDIFPQSQVRTETAKELVAEILKELNFNPWNILP